MKRCDSVLQVKKSAKLWKKIKKMGGRIWYLFGKKFMV